METTDGGRRKNRTGSVDKLGLTTTFTQGFGKSSGSKVIKNEEQKESEIEQQIESDCSICL